MAWYNGSWDYRVKITVLAAEVDADLTDFPVYVDLSDLPVGFHTNVNQTDARDIRVTTSDGTTEIPREVVFYTAASDTGELHFKGDVANATDTDFYIYYGNAGASDYATTDTYGRNNVWSGYHFVAHLQANATDSKAGATGTVTDATLADSQIYKGYSFAGGISNDNIDYNDIVNLEWNQGWSISAWLKAGTADRNMQAVSKVEPISDYTGFAFYKSSNAQGGHSMGIDIIQTYPTKCLRVTGSTAINDNTLRLHHLTYSGSGLNTGLKLYVNAALETNSVKVDSTTLDGTIVSTSDFMIGNRDTTATNVQAWDGLIDEVRVASSVLSATWISTEHSNQSAPDSFYTAGSEETQPTGGGVINTLYLRSLK